MVNLDRLSIFPDDAEVTPEDMVSAGIVKGLTKPIKVLGNGELTHRMVVKAHKFSQAAKNKIELAGGKAEVIA